MKNSEIFERYVAGEHDSEGHPLTRAVKNKFQLLKPRVITPRFAGPYAPNLKTGKSSHLCCVFPQ